MLFNKLYSIWIFVEYNIKLRSEEEWLNELLNQGETLGSIIKKAYLIN